MTHSVWHFISITKSRFAASAGKWLKGRFEIFLYLSNRKQMSRFDSAQAVCCSTSPFTSFSSATMMLVSATDYEIWTMLSSLNSEAHVLAP